MTSLREATPDSTRANRPGRRRFTRAARQNGEVRLPCRVRLADGRIFTGSLPACKHRALQLGLLHGESGGLVELTPGTRPPGGKVDIDRRKHTCHYLPGGAGARSEEWLERLLDHAERIVGGEYAYRRFDGDPREEAFVGVAARTRPQGSKHAVAHTRFLWVDVDKPGELPALWGLLAERPCQLLLESAGSGGMHAYWQLAEPLPAVTVDSDLTAASAWSGSSARSQADPPHWDRTRRSAVCRRRHVRRAGAGDASGGNDQLQDRSLQPTGAGRSVACAVLRSRARRRPAGSGGPDRVISTTAASLRRWCRGSVPPNPAAGGLREAGRRQRAALGLRPIPVIAAQREDSVMPRLAGAVGRLVVLRVRRRRPDLRSRIAGTRRSHRTGVGRRGFKAARPLVADQFGQLR